VSVDGAVNDVDARVRALLEGGHRAAGVTETLRVFGPELLGFIAGVLRDDTAADEIFAAVSERLWRSLHAFAWRCSLRTWLYVVARNEIARYGRGERRHVAGRERISELADVMAVARSTWQSKRERLDRLRDELPMEERQLLVLRIDRGLAWEEVALAFVEDPERHDPAELERTAARLRKRFQLVKDRLLARAQEEGLLGRGTRERTPPR
jgi:RNA polymerase sigma-70 factor (ECF subfamily)